MADEPVCTLDIEKHIAELEAQRDALLEKENRTPEEEEELHSLKRRIYRSRVRGRCC